MRILLITSVLRPKNDEIHDFLYEIAVGLTKKGQEVMIVAAHHKGMPKRDSFKGVKIRRFQYFWPASMQKLAYGQGLAQNIRASALAKAQLLPYIISGTIETYRAIREFKPDIVQALWSFPQGFMAKVLQPFLKFRFALHIFGAEPFLAKTYRLPFAVTWPAKSADLLTANSKAALDATVSLGVKREKINLLFLGGVNTKKFNSGNNGQGLRKKLGLGNSKMILVVGRIVERKGHKYLIEAMPTILKKFKTAKLVIVGYGPEMQSLKELSKKIGVQDSVLFQGKVPAKELALYYAGCNVFCLPAIVDSKGETEGGQGMVIGEAMASGKPVVASNVGGIPDAVKHNVNGLLVPEKNPERLARAICTVLSDKKLAERLSKSGKQFVDREISYEVAVERFAELYRQTMQKGL